MKIENKDVLKILDMINNHGEGLLVGGAVRDTILGIEPKDYDISTNLPYEKTKDIFAEYNPIEIGKAFGVVQITMNGNKYEIAKYRSDGVYTDSIRPDSVVFVNDFSEDSKRRDFNINAMGTDGKVLYDFYGGRQSLLEGEPFKCVGIAEDRIKEDPIRMLRAVRFSTTMSIKMSSTLRFAIKEHSNLLMKIPKERIKAEFDKIILSKRSDYGIILLSNLGLLEYIVPELKKAVGFDQRNKRHDKDLFEHSIVTMKNTKPILENRLAGLLHDLGKMNCMTIEDNVTRFYGHDIKSSKLSIKIMKRLGYSNKQIDTVSKLIANHMNKQQALSDKAAKRLIVRIGEENVDALMDLMRADILGHKPPFSFNLMERLESKIDFIINSKEPKRVSELPVSGHDVMRELNIPPSKKVGTVLGLLMEDFLENPQMTRDDGLDAIRKYKDLFFD